MLWGGSVGWWVTRGYCFLTAVAQRTCSSGSRVDLSIQCQAEKYSIRLIHTPVP